MNIYVKPEVEEIVLTVADVVTADGEQGTSDSIFD